jgi:hypothetical protein
MRTKQNKKIEKKNNYKTRQLMILFILFYNIKVKCNKQEHRNNNSINNNKNNMMHEIEM